MKINFLKIKAATPDPCSHPGFHTFVQSMEEVVKEVIPEEVIPIPETSYFIPLDLSFEKLKSALPIISLSEGSATPCTLSLTVLCREEYTHGVCLFLCDMVAHKLFPEKKMPIGFVRSLAFRFIVQPKERYYVMEIFLEAENVKELNAIRNNFPRFKEDVTLTILGVEHARKIVLTKGQSIEEKRMILSENLESLIRKSLGLLKQTNFKDVQDLLLKTMYDEDPHQIPNHILPHIKTKPQNFELLIFKEMEKFAAFLHQGFAIHRPLSHLTKCISYLYLFRKILSRLLLIQSGKRHLSLKLLVTHVQSLPTLALVMGVNFIDPNEALGTQDICRVVSAIVPSARFLPESDVINEEEKGGIRLLYMEFQKEDGKQFSPNELKALKKHLPKDIRGKIRLVKEDFSSHEKAKEILSLAKELTSEYASAQIIIQFHNTTTTYYYFHVILAKIRKIHSEPLELSYSPPIIIRKEIRKTASILKGEFLKEIYLYEVAIQKENRDLSKARLDLFSWIHSHVPHLQDFNGEMISRKYENLCALKELLSDSLQSNFVEKYFYSITPPYLQTLISPLLLKEHFNLFLKVLEKDLLKEEVHMLKKEFQDHILIAIASTHFDLFDRIRQEIPLGKTNIAITSATLSDLHVFGIILPKEQQHHIEFLDDLIALV